jgi:hypothetical protein
MRGVFWSECAVMMIESIDQRQGPHPGEAFAPRVGTIFSPLENYPEKSGSEGITAKGATYLSDLPYQRPRIVSPQCYDASENEQLFPEVTKQMASVLVGQFHARDAEGRVYPVHEFRESLPTGADGTEPKSIYKLAIGDRVNHIEGDVFELVQSKIRITRVD